MQLQLALFRCQKVRPHHNHLKASLKSQGDLH